MPPPPTPSAVPYLLTTVCFHKGHLDVPPSTLALKDNWHPYFARNLVGMAGGRKQVSGTEVHENGKQPATTSPDPPSGRAMDDTPPPLLPTMETRSLPGHDSPRTSPRHPSETLHDSSIEPATRVSRPASHIDIESRPTPQEESHNQREPPPHIAYGSKLRPPKSSAAPSSSGKTRKRPTASPSHVIYRVASLNPENMAAARQPIFDISGKREFTFEINGQRQRFSYSQPFIGMKTDTLRAERLSKVKTPFPQGTTGILYYCPPPANRPGASGALRFRVCRSLAKFDQGTDLKTPSGSPWGPSLYSIATAPRLDWNFVVDALVRDNGVDMQLVKDLRYTTQSFLPHDHPTMRILYDISDPFEIDLQGPLYKLQLISRHNVGVVDVYGAFKDYPGIRPYCGRIRVRFERLPFQKEPTLVLRVLERLTPITCTVPDYDGRIAIPLKGGLMERRILNKYNKRQRQGQLYKPFTIILNRKTDNGCAILDTFPSEELIPPKLVEE
ncbi:hypothetical protein D9619_007367 [Psilocybe cf. subviscida]|uniref:Uncharacterized protein n=1 Tax=Psilocybe cf. subviscida TaxID=2480587 RepID=A0A8H5B349_9AGAR|nr:hypothetical protein D9619_007367 [Psilocybe cf. subviscida]